MFNLIKMSLKYFFVNLYLSNMLTHALVLIRLNIFSVNKISLNSTSARHHGWKGKERYFVCSHRRKLFYDTLIKHWHFYCSSCYQSTLFMICRYGNFTYGWIYFYLLYSMFGLLFWSTWMHLVFKLLLYFVYSYKFR